MKEGLKIRIQDYKKVEADLMKLGAIFLKELNVVDTYFRQPAGEVLKITEDDEGDFLVNLKLKNGKFQIVKYKPVNNVKKVKKEFADRFGVKCVLEKKRRFFNFKDCQININLIKDVGEFLIIEGENLTPEIITEKLGIKDQIYLCFV
jgi:adenylate cyclase class IV